MLIAYPAWDAVANYFDAGRSGGLDRNTSQKLNLVVSAVTVIAVGIALGQSMNTVILAYAVWAALAGLFQFATAVRRWKSVGAQWVMILSGAQSILAGGFMPSSPMDPSRSVSPALCPMPRSALSIFWSPRSG